MVAVVALSGCGIPVSEERHCVPQPRELAGLCLDNRGGDNEAFLRFCGGNYVRAGACFVGYDGGAGRVVHRCRVQNAAYDAGAGSVLLYQDLAITDERTPQQWCADQRGEYAGRL